MFTGIIGAIGKVVRCDSSRVWIQIPFSGVRLGESIAIDGVCLTVAKRKGSILAFDVGPETHRITTLSNVLPGRAVNLERALRVGDRLGGHWVTGHVEGMGSVVKIERSGSSRWIFIRIPSAFHRWVIAKGSLAVDGISLTVVSRSRDVVKIMAVPHTLSHTTLGLKGVGDRVNLEPDLLAKYAVGERS